MYRLVLFSILMFNMENTIQAQTACRVVTTCLKNNIAFCDRRTENCPPCLYLSQGVYQCYDRNNGVCPFTAEHTDCTNQIRIPGVNPPVQPAQPVTNTPPTQPAPVADTPTPSVNKRTRQPDRAERSNQSRDADNGGGSSDDSSWETWQLVAIGAVIIVTVALLTAIMCILCKGKKKEMMEEKESQVAVQHPKARPTSSVYYSDHITSNSSIIRLGDSMVDFNAEEAEPNLLSKQKQRAMVDANNTEFSTISDVSVSSDHMAFSVVYTPTGKAIKKKSKTVREHSTYLDEVSTQRKGNSSFFETTSSIHGKNIEQVKQTTYLDEVSETRREDNSSELESDAQVYANLQPKKRVQSSYLDEVDSNLARDTDFLDTYSSANKGGAKDTGSVYQLSETGSANLEEFVLKSNIDTNDSFISEYSNEINSVMEYAPEYPSNASDADIVLSVLDDRYSGFSDNSSTYSSYVSDASCYQTEDGKMKREYQI